MLRLARRGFSLQGSRACRAESNHERKVCVDLSPPQAANATGGTRTPTGCTTSAQGWRVCQYRHGRAAKKSIATASGARVDALGRGVYFSAVPVGLAVRSEERRV